MEGALRNTDPSVFKEGSPFSLGMEECRLFEADPCPDIPARCFQTSVTCVTHIQNLIFWKGQAFLVLPTMDHFLMMRFSDLDDFQEPPKAKKLTMYGALGRSGM